MPEEVSGTASKGAGFFHIDRRVWKLLCGRKDINQAVAYLTVAAGTGRGGRASWWSAQAVEKYTGLHSSRAKVAISSLIAGGYLRRSEKSKRTNPLYELLAFDSVCASALADESSRSPYFNSVVLGAIGKNKPTLSVSRELAAYALKGLIRKNGERYESHQPVCDGEWESSELIWLPNTLITGTPNGERSPIGRLRSSGDIWALRLLVDFYHAQNLSADGGISRAAIRHTYTRKQYGERGRHVIWGFKKDQSNSSSHAATSAFWEAAELTGKYESDLNKIWAAVNLLLSMGLLTCVPHLVENSKADCELLHGCGWDGRGEEIEVGLAQAASAAAEYVIGEQRCYTAKIQDGVNVLIPVFDTLPNVQMVGVYRLTYRPHTSLTADWMRRMREAGEEWQAAYARIGPPAVISKTGT